MALSKISPAAQEQYAGERNLIINGAMQVAQRGTTYSHNPNTGGYHTVDRYSYRRAGTWSGITAVALSQESTGGPDGFTNYLRYAPTGSDATTASDTAMYIDYKIEGNVMAHLGLGSSAAQPFTLSFYVRSSVTGTFSLSARDAATSNWTKYITEYTINSANTWERKTITFPAVTTGTFYNDYITGMTLMWTLSADSASSTYATSSTNTWLSDANDSRWSTNQTDALTTTSGNTFDITGIQLEVGSTATPFEHRSYADELARCQRYFQTSFPSGNDIGATGLAITQTGALIHVDGTGYGPVLLPVTMRSAGTAVVYAALANPSINYGRRHYDGAVHAVLGTTVTTTTLAVGFATGTNTVYQCGYTLDSEL